MDKLKWRVHILLVTPPIRDHAHTTPRNRSRTRATGGAP